MKAVISVIGKDRRGIIYHISKILYENDINILDISQTIMQEIFTMVAMVDISKSSVDFETLKGLLSECAETNVLQIHVQHEDIFSSMHNI